MKVLALHPGLIGEPQHHVCNILGTSPTDQVDIYVHTWGSPDNLLNLKKFKSISRRLNFKEILIEGYNYKYAGLLKEFAPHLDINSQNSPDIIKKFAVFYSMYQIVNKVVDIEQYDIAIKIKADLDVFGIDLQNYPDEEYHQFQVNRAFNYPFLEKVTPADCIFAIKLYRAFIERAYYTTPKVLTKVFKKPLSEFITEVATCYKKLYKEAGNEIDIEGNLIWQELMDFHKIPVLQTSSILVGTPVGKTPVMSIDSTFKIINNEILAP